MRQQHRSLVMTSLAICSVAFLFAIGSVPLAFASTSTPVSPALATVNVTLSFSPKTVKVAPGASVMNTLSITNKGKTSITFTGCLYYTKLSTSKTYTKGTCSVTSPIAVGAGQTLKETWTTTVGSTTPKGTYNAKVYLTNSADESKAGAYTIDVS